MSKRTEVEKYIYSLMDTIDPSGKNKERYQEKFKNMNDKEFDAFMNRIKNNEEDITLYAANMVDKITKESLIASSKKVGIELLERVKRYDKVVDSYYTTPNKYTILQVPIRRFSQFVDHKLSVPEGDTRIDVLTGQVMKPDKAGSISQVEIQTMHAKGLKHTIAELASYRGGNVVEFAEYKRELEEQGTTNLRDNENTVNRSAVSLDGFYAGMHIESNASGV